MIPHMRNRAVRALVCLGLLCAGGLSGGLTAGRPAQVEAASVKAAQQLHVSVSPSSIKVGRDVSLTIKVTGNKGAPVNAQVSLTGAGPSKTAVASHGKLNVTVRALALGKATLNVSAAGFSPIVVQVPIVAGSPATVEAIRNGASVLLPPAKKARPATVGTDLQANDHAITGNKQYASLGLRDGTLVDLNADTDVVIHDPLHNTLNSGEMFVEVVHGAGSHQVQVGTTVVATKGTRLDITYNTHTKTASVTVVEGLVQVANHGVTIIVGAGQRTIVPFNQRPQHVTQVNVGPIVSWVKNLPNTNPDTVPPIFTSPVPAPIPPVTAPSVRKPSATYTGSLPTSTLSGVIELTGNVTIPAGVTVTVAPGAIVLMGSGASLEVAGTLKAAGAGAKPITFMSAAPTPKAGDWQYVRFNGAGAKASILNYVHFFHGSSGYQVAGMVMLISGADIHIANSYFEQSLATGLYIDDATRPVIVNCTFFNTSLDGKGEYALSAPIDDLALFTNLHTVQGQNGVGLRSGAVAHPGAWHTFDVPFVLTGSVTVPSKVTLTIAPGTVVAMGSGTSLEVVGTLNAAGTAAAPITFTSASLKPQPGDWQYIRFNGAEAGSSTFQHVQVFYGSNGYQVSGMVAVISGANLTLGNDYFAQGTSSAVWVDDSSRPTITNDTFAGNGGLAVDANVDEMTMISDLHLGDGQQGLNLRPGALSHSGTWPRMELPITLAGSITVPQGITLTVAPGATVAMTTNVALEIEGDLQAIGTPQAPVTFTSAYSQPAPGNWQYIRFNGASSSASVLSYAQVLFGSTGYQVGGTIAVISDATPKITNSYIAEGLGIGIWLDDSTGTRPTIADCTVADYPGHAVEAPLDEMPHITNLFIGQGQDGLWLRGGTISQGGTWPALSIPIDLEGSATLASGSTLSLSPGITIAMTGGISLEIDGALLSMGTAANPVTITSALPNPKAGDWQYLRFNGASAAKSVLQYTIVEYGSSGYQVPSMVNMISGASITVKNSQFLHGTTIGIYADDGSLPTIQDTTFGDLAGAAISVPNAGVKLLSGNHFLGNQQQVVTHT